MNTQPLPSTPTSSSLRITQSTKQKVRPAPYPLRLDQQDPKSRLTKSQQLLSPLYSRPSPSRPTFQSQEPSLLRTSSLPPYQISTTSSQTASALSMQVPVFGHNSTKSESSPLVFSPSYITAFLNKFEDQDKSAPSSSKSWCQDQHQLLTPHPTCQVRPGPQRCHSESLVHGQQRPAQLRPVVVPQCTDIASVSVTPTNGSQYIHISSTAADTRHDAFPSARTTLIGSIPGCGAGIHAPEEDRDPSVAPSLKLQLKLLEEKHKQKYAIELIEQALATINRIWPETAEIAPPAKPSVVVTVSTSVSPITPAFGPQARHLHHQVLQQATPESSPASLSKKRKRVSPHESTCPPSQMDLDTPSNKKRAGFLPGAENVPMHVTPPAASHPDPPQPQPSSSSPITLRLFVRELLRRSKTHCSTLEVALCYLDGVEETVRRLKDCYKLGMTFGTVAMAEKGVYEEGMKDEKRVMSLAEVEAESLELSYLDHSRQDDSGNTWAPISPESDHEESRTAAKCCDGPSVTTSPPDSTAASSLNILSSHPLLDPRRSFLAALVIATKFLQDRAYSNKAWAKLSGLPAQEIGRCERALGGALSWRVWVGKDFGKPCTPMVSVSSLRPSEGAEEIGGMDLGSTEEGTNTEDVIHGLNDPLAESFIAAAAAAQSQARTTASATSTSPLLTAATASSMLSVPAVVAGGWSRAKSWPCITPSTSTSASSSAPWLSDDAISLASDCTTVLDLASSGRASVCSASPSSSVPHLVEPSSLAASLEIINSMLEEAENKRRSSASTVDTLVNGSGANSVAPSTPETIIVPAEHHLPQPITAGKTPVMPMYGAFATCASPLQMDAGAVPYPFSFIVPHQSTTSASQVSPNHLQPVLSAVPARLSPLSAGSFGSVGSRSSASSLASTSFLSPDNIDTPPPQLLPHSTSQPHIHIPVNRHATLVDNSIEFGLDCPPAYSKPQRYLPQPLVHNSQHIHALLGPTQRWTGVPEVITHVPPANYAF